MPAPRFAVAFQQDLVVCLQENDVGADALYLEFVQEVGQQVEVICVVARIDADRQPAG